MAGLTGNAEFWLPLEFLSDEDFIPKKNNQNASIDSSLFPADFPYEHNHTALISPGESVIGFSENECDEEELLSNLAMKFAAQASILRSPDVQKSWPLSTSPQSPLSRIPTWSSSSGSSNDLSPPETPLEVNNDALEVIYAAAGQVAKMKMESEARFHEFSPYLSSSRSCNPANPSQVRNPRQFPITRPENTPRIPPASDRSPAMLAKNRFQQQQMEFINNGRRYSEIPVQTHMQREAHRRLQRPTVVAGRSGMNAVFLNGNGVKRESVGTGVFLPRRYTNASEPKKKTGCSPVLLPDRVVQALNLNLESLGPSVTHIPIGGSILDCDSLMARRNAQLMDQKRRIYRSECSPTNEVKVQMLPQEWTY